MRTDRSATLKRTLALNARAVWGRAYSRVVAANRVPAWLIFDTLLPLLGLSAYVFVYKALDAPKEFTGFVVLGGTMMAYWMSVLWSMASQFYWEKLSGQLELFMVSPASTMAILLGMALGGIVMTTVRAAAVLALGLFIFRVAFHIHLPVFLVLYFLTTLVALYGMGMLFSSLYMLWGREAWHISNLFQEPVFLLSGFYFPLRSLGFWVAVAASIIPVSMGLDGIRQLAYGDKAQGFIPVGYEMIVLGVLAVAFLFLSSKALKLMERKAREAGTLSTRWQ
jgi:ABC-2 type transport system permease protein